MSSSSVRWAAYSLYRRCEPAADVRRFRAAACPAEVRPARPALAAGVCYDAGMAGQPSFDVTSTVDVQEVDNAVNQAKKEIAQRYDFKGSKSSIDFKRAENVIELVADDNFKMEAVWDILQTRMVRRGVPVKNLKPRHRADRAAGSSSAR